MAAFLSARVGLLFEEQYKAERLFDLHLLDNDLHFLDSYLWICALG